MEFDAEVNLEDVIDSPTLLDKTIEEAGQKAEQRLWNDSEWAEPRVTSLKDIVTAFLVGTISADAWFDNYSVPSNFEIVANALSGAVMSKFGPGEFPNVSLLDIEAFYHEFIDATPLCREWNDFPGSGFVTRYDATPKHRTFIDLDALIRNASVFIRDDRRTFDKFNADFDKRQEEAP